MFKKDEDLLNNLKSFVQKWNLEFPLDLWYRRKYKIPFNSSKHRELSPIDIRFEYEEEKFIDNIIKERNVLDKKQKEYKENRKWIDPLIELEEFSEEEIIEYFDSIDLNEINKNRLEAKKNNNLNY